MEHASLKCTESRGIAYLVPVAPVNPYQRRLATELNGLGLQVFLENDVKVLARKRRSDAAAPRILHLHWLFTFRWRAGQITRLFLYLIRLWALRRNGYRLVWTAHNLYAHESVCKACDRIITRLVMRLVSGIIVHSPSAKNVLAREFSARARPAVHVIPHGNYIDWYPNSIPRAEARKRLEIGDCELVIGLMGNLRPYKGLEELIGAFRTFRSADLRLLIAGKPADESFGTHLATLVSEDRRIIFKPGRIPDQEMQIYFNASNAVAFPYREILTSGALVLAMSFGRACVAPRLGCIPDYLDANCGILYDDGAGKGIKTGLQQVLDLRESLDAMGRCAYERAQRWDWRDIAVATLEPYGLRMEPTEVEQIEDAKGGWWPCREP